MAVQTSMAPSGLAEVLDRILDKGIVIDAWVRVSLLGLGGLVATALAGLWYHAAADESARAALTAPLALPYLAAAVAAGVLHAAAWLLQLTKESFQARWLWLGTASLIVTVLGMNVVRESVRLHATDVEALYPLHEKALGVGGFPVFLVFAAICAAILIVCIRAVRCQAQRC